MNEKETTITTKERLEKALISFIERAAKPNATPAEVEALPRAADSLERLLRLY